MKRTSRKIVFKKLKPGKYVLRVRAKNEIGWSTASSKVRIRVHK